eukprot:3356748-Pleurochrysis_carterae.AAC.1
MFNFCDHVWATERKASFKAATMLHHLGRKSDNGIFLCGIAVQISAMLSNAFNSTSTEIVAPKLGMSEPSRQPNSLNLNFRHPFKQRLLLTVQGICATSVPKQNVRVSKLLRVCLCVLAKVVKAFCSVDMVEQHARVSCDVAYEAEDLRLGHAVAGAGAFVD